jgi:uncharacterized protein YprB with RNaseH-like and TPR domain
MSTLVDRLRGIVAAVPGGSTRPLEQESQSSGDDADATAEILGGQWRESSGHRFLVIDRTYRPGHRHGRLTLVDHVLPDEGSWQEVLTNGGAKSSPGQRALFIDLETTGLAGGAGSYAFLVGCGWFERSTFRVRQFFMSSYTAERLLLETLAELAASAHLVVSYNGKTFDLPLIETRFLFNRLATPFAGIPHLDMLHPARRLWRADDGGGVPVAANCRLSVLEQTVCGHTRQDDVPGFEIPGRYFHYVRTGDPRPLQGVVEHNRLDLLSLALMTARAAQLVEEGPASVKTVREAVGLGRLYERAGMRTKARACFARACGMDDASPVGRVHSEVGRGRSGVGRVLSDPADADTGAVVEALWAYALLCRREHHYRDAAAAWRQLIEMKRCPPHVFREATEALAVYHEHRLRDPGAAMTFAMKSLPFQGTPARRQALDHRLTRLNRKLRDPVVVPAWLF